MTFFPIHCVKNDDLKRLRTKILTGRTDFVLGRNDVLPFGANWKTGGELVQEWGELVGGEFVMGRIRNGAN